MADTDDLISRVHALPRELFDKIYELTFTSLSDEHYIDREYKPPSCLQVSRQTRKHFAKTYYGNGSIFYVKKKDCLQWLASLRETDPLWRIQQQRNMKTVEIRLLDLSVRRIPGKERNLGNLSDIFWFTTMLVRSLEKSTNGTKADPVDLSGFKIQAIDEVEGWTRWINEQEAYELYRSGKAGGKDWSI